jgi:hypothetical protein
MENRTNLTKEGSEKKNNWNRQTPNWCKTKWHFCSNSQQNGLAKSMPGVQKVTPKQLTNATFKQTIEQSN